MHQLHIAKNYRTVLCSLLIVAASSALADSLPPLPEAVSNNAVVSLKIGDLEYVASFAGISVGLRHSDVHARSYVLNSTDHVWEHAPDLPGVVGRLASTAISVGNRMYVFGGYSVEASGDEKSRPWVHAFDPVEKQYTEVQVMPVPVDDAVAVGYLDRYIYLISGWHDLGNVNLVQVFDTQTNSWVQATPIPGKSLFGHAGGIVENRVLYCDGVAISTNRAGPREFVASNECFLGTIDEKNFRRIDWHPVGAHPGLPRYRMAAAGLSSKDAIAFIGGSVNPYNYDGIGYNGSPSEPSADILIFDLDQMHWRIAGRSAIPTMDHRGLVRFDDAWHTLGGMLSQQKVTDQVTSYALD